MIPTTVSPLEESDSSTLYKLLGDAWYAQLKPSDGASYYLPSSTDVGKREFATVAPHLFEALRQPFYHDFFAILERTIQREAAWKMPPAVVAALALRVPVVQTNDVLGLV
jgi:hypothetical protein